MELRDLYNKFISEGYTDFYIEGIGGPKPDEVYCLGYDNLNWCVYYINKGDKSKPKFETKDKNEAFRYYAKYISSLQHFHLIVFTKSNKILKNYKLQLEKLNIKTKVIKTTVYNLAHTKEYRLFVVNKDIFEVTSSFPDLPFIDDDLL